MRALGLMSGTSMDGVDAAVLETDGETIAGFGPSAFAAYGAEDRALLRGALGKWPGEAGLEAVEARVRAAHAAAVAGFDGRGSRRVSWANAGARAAGAGARTRSGRGDWLAREVGVPVVWDFRTADVASGGEGAPLVPFFHFACARWIGAEAPVAFLNLGGVGNVTWVDPRKAGAGGGGGAGGVRHRAGERADRRFPRRCGWGGRSTRTGRWRRRGGWTRRCWPGWRRIPISQGSRRSRWTGRISMRSWIGWPGSRPRTGRRRWRR